MVTDGVSVCLFGFCLLRAILFTIALKRSSCERSAFKIAHTTSNVLLLSRASSAEISDGTTIGMMIYPYFFSSDFPLWNVRITRPTDCTTSTCELRAERNNTASRDGTSTPSDRQRTLVTTRHSRSLSGSSASHCRIPLRSCEFIEPSICRVVTETVCERLSESRFSSYFLDILGSTEATYFEVPAFVSLPMAEQNATARRIMRGSASHVRWSSPCIIFDNPFITPMSLDVSSKFSSVVELVMSCFMLAGTSSSLTVRTSTL